MIEKKMAAIINVNHQVSQKGGAIDTKTEMPGSVQTPSLFAAFTRNV